MDSARYSSPLDFVDLLDAEVYFKLTIVCQAIQNYVKNYMISKENSLVRGITDMEREVSNKLTAEIRYVSRRNPRIIPYVLLLLTTGSVRLSSEIISHKISFRCLSTNHSPTNILDIPEEIFYETLLPYIPVVEVYCQLRHVCKTFFEYVERYIKCEAKIIVTSGEANSRQKRLPSEVLLVLRRNKSLAIGSVGCSSHSKKFWQMVPQYLAPYGTKQMVLQYLLGKVKNFLQGKELLVCQKGGFTYTTREKTNGYNHHGRIVKWEIFVPVVL